MTGLFSIPNKYSSMRECTLVPRLAAASLPPGFFLAHLSKAALLPDVADKIVVTEGKEPYGVL